MPSNSGLTRLGVNMSGAIDNQGDFLGDDILEMPEALRELRAETILNSSRTFEATGGTEDMFDAISIGSVSIPSNGSQMDTHYECSDEDCLTAISVETEQEPMALLLSLNEVNRAAEISNSLLDAHFDSSAMLQAHDGAEMGAFAI